MPSRLPLERHSQTNLAPVESARTTLFVTGASRSGTTLVSRILGGHDRILRLRELHYFGEIWDVAQSGRALDAKTVASYAAVLHTRQANGIYHAGRPEEVDLRFGRTLSEELRDPDGLAVFLAATRRLAMLAGKQIACEQTPRNIFYGRRLLELDEGIRMIQMLRDPRAVAASQKNRWRRRKLSVRGVPFSEALRTWSNYHSSTMARLWLKAAKCGEPLRSHPRFMTLRYEDLVTEPESAVRRLCEFAGVEFNPTMLDVPVVGSSHEQELGRRGISAHGIDAWRKVLTPCETRLIEDTCGETMQSHGYALSNPVCSSFDELNCRFRYLIHLTAAAMVNPRRSWIQARAILKR